MLYNEDSFTVAAQVREWAAENGPRPNLRIALCGYEGEHNDLEKLNWTKTAWTANGGMANMHNVRRPNANRKKERIWFSPNCLGKEKDEG